MKNVERASPAIISYPTICPTFSFRFNYPKVKETAPSTQISIQINEVPGLITSISRKFWPNVTAAYLSGATSLCTSQEMKLEATKQLSTIALSCESCLGDMRLCSLSPSILEREKYHGIQKHI